MTDAPGLSAHEARLRALASLLVAEDRTLTSTVRGWSMTGTLDAGVEIQIAAQRPPRVGDVVAFAAGVGLIAHRLEHIARDGRAFIARGDGCLLCDPPGDMRAIVGVVERWRPSADAPWHVVGADPPRPGWRGACARGFQHLVIAALDVHLWLARAVHAVAWLSGGRYLAARSGAR